MPAFTYNLRVALKSNIAQLFARSAGHDRLEITPAEFQSLFVSQEDWKILHQAHTIAAVSRYGRETSFDMEWPTDVTVDDFKRVKIEVDGGYCDLKFLFPKKPVLQSDAPVELLATINAWVNRAIVRGLDFGRTMEVLDQLDDHCTNAKTVRYMWPALQAIGRVDPHKDNCNGMADKIGKCKAPARMPALSPALKAACRTTGGTVAAALLLSDPPDNEHKGIQIGLSRRIRVKEEGLDVIEVLVE